MVKESIFKSYDIRGIYSQELNKETAFNLGQSFVELTGVKQVVIGRDARLSSPALFSALSQGITNRGVDVYNIGQVPTEALYFTVGNYQYDSGIMITASHNSKEYNGFKMIKRGREKIEVVRGKDIASIMEKEDLPEVEKKGEVKELNIWQDFISHILSFADVNKITPLKIVIDASNGMAGKVLPQLLDKLPIKSLNLNFELDGNFPAHSPNPLDKEAQALIKETIRKEKADFGFIFDGDADRVFLLDETGDFKRGDITLLLLAKYFLRKNPGAGIVYNVMSSKAVPEFINKWKGKSIRTPVGFVNIRERMIKNNGILGGEVSGHYCFRDNFYFDSGFIAFLLLLQIISESGRKVSELTSELSIYPGFSELNFEVKNKEKVLGKIKEEYSNGEQDFLDGITIEYKDWWFNLRPSNTESLLRLTIEAKTKELLEEKKKELATLIRGEK